jgi:predicted MPP superfamily phosphohydrolase
VYAILGNHDYGDYAYWKNYNEKIENNKELSVFYKNIGWNLLNNESRIVVKDKDTIAIIGVENWGSLKRFKKTADLKKAVFPYNHIAVKLLLSHDPSYWDKVVSKDFPDIDITFSGHTHGMQFGIDTKKFKFSPVQMFYKYWSGLYRLKNKSQKSQYLYVNNGLGNIVYPGRVGILPEITVFTLKNNKNKNSFSGETNREKVKLK